MTLEFPKVEEQVKRMGRAVAMRNATLSEKGALAREWLAGLDDLGPIRERVWLARQRDIGFRGAAPAGPLHEKDKAPEINEPLNRAYPLPPVPARATIIAADGSQVYPNLHGAALYYLTNVGLFVYHHGLDALPEQFTEPRLNYTNTMLFAEGRLIANAAVNARRNVAELLVLAREAYARRDDHTCPMLALVDGPLLFWAGKDVPDSEQLEREYRGGLVLLNDLHGHMQKEHGAFAALAGYVDRPTSAFLVSLLHLMSLDEPNVREAAIKTNGALEGLSDAGLLFSLLEPGQRTALLVQQSPANKKFRHKGASHEIAFFYLNVGTPGKFHLARVEIPGWVAATPAMVDAVHALVYDQCGMMWRYPYALTRADEIAVVRGHERARLNEMIEQELLNNAQAVEGSEKLESKVVRHGRTRYGQKKR